MYLYKFYLRYRLYTIKNISSGFSSLLLGHFLSSYDRAQQGECHLNANQGLTLSSQQREEREKDKYTGRDGEKNEEHAVEGRGSISVQTEGNELEAIGEGGQGW